MKKLLSLLTISTLATSVPAPLLANTVLERVKRDVGATAKDVTTGFDIKIISKSNKWHTVDKNNLKNEFNQENNKWYILIFKKQIILKEKYNQKDKITISKFNNYELLKFGKRNLQHFFIKPLEWSVYRWDGVGEPQTPIIDDNGNITDWNLKITDSTLFQQGILFSLADGSKTAKWSNNGMRLTVDDETNININNPNIEEVYWDGAKQKMLGNKANINVKPETRGKNHKLFIKYDINGTKYTSEDIDVVMAAKIEPSKPIVKENLSDVIKFDKNNDLGNIIDNNDDTIKTKIIEKNSLAIDFSQIKITNKDNNKATLSVIEGSESYQGSVVVKYNISSVTTVDLKIDLTSTASGVQIDKDYLAQLDSSKMTNKVDTFYYANGKSVIKIKQPPIGNVITGVVYGCNDKWNKTPQSKPIDPTVGILLLGSQLSGRYLIELQYSILPAHKKNIYLQISQKQQVPHYWNTDNGKQFEQWANDNGYDNIRGYSASQLNNLFELSKTWKQILKHLDLKLDNFVVDKIQNVSQDEIDNYKTKIIASVKAQVEKYAPDVVENTDYKILVDNFVAGDWTASKDVKVQAVDGSKKLLSFTTKTIPVQQKEQQTPPTPGNNKKGGLTGWAIFGLVVGLLMGLFLLAWLFKRFVITPFILEPIRKKKEKAFAEKKAKDIAQMKKDDEEWESKQKGGK